MMEDASDSAGGPRPPAKRPLSIGRKIVHAVAPPVISLLVKACWRTCRIERVLGQEHADSVLAAEKPIIPCYWHQRQFFCVRYVIGLQRRGIKIGFLVSPSRDGELAARVLSRFGLHTIRGSSTRTGAQAMRGLYQAIRRDGVSPVTTPDGPTGPPHKFKPGTVMLAQLSGAPMLPVSYAASKGWRLKTWDRFLIPRPFARIVIAVGRPRYVERASAASRLDAIRQEMEDTLMNLEAEAEHALRN